jgi:hypothetical protein
MDTPGCLLETAGCGEDKLGAPVSVVSLRVCNDLGLYHRAEEVERLVTGAVFGRVLISDVGYGGPLSPFVCFGPGRT